MDPICPEHLFKTLASQNLKFSSWEQINFLFIYAETNWEATERSNFNFDSFIVTF